MSSHSSAMVEQCIDIIQSINGTHPLTVAAAQLIAADAEWNSRFYDLKASASEDRLLELLETYEAFIEVLATATAKFARDPKGERNALLEVLVSTRQRLSELR